MNILCDFVLSQGGLAGRLATCDCFFHDGEEEGGAAHQCFQRLDLCAAASSKRKDTARLEAAGSSDPHFEPTHHTLDFLGASLTFKRTMA